MIRATRAIAVFVMIKYLPKQILRNQVYVVWEAIAYLTDPNKKFLWYHHSEFFRCVSDNLPARVE